MGGGGSWQELKDSMLILCLYSVEFLLLYTVESRSGPAVLSFIEKLSMHFQR